MYECPVLKTCSLLNKNTKISDKDLKKFKYNYCLCKNSICARLIVARFLGVNFVPNNLLPNEMNKAEKIINKDSSLKDL